MQKWSRVKSAAVIEAMRFKSYPPIAVSYLIQTHTQPTTEISLDIACMTIDTSAHVCYLRVKK